MIKKLQRKFVLIAMASVFLVMSLVIGSINGINIYQINQKIDGLLRILAENDGNFPKFNQDKPKKPMNRQNGIHITPETPYETRYFVIYTDESNAITQVDTLHIAAITADEAVEYGEKILSGHKWKGYIGNYKYLMTEKDGKRTIVVLDCSSDRTTSMTFLFISTLIGLISFLVVFLLVSIFSRKAIHPVVESMEKQKQFITDAGHEIKTPLAIIQANTEVLEMIEGGNEWTGSIRNQISRLDSLIKNLLTLSQMEEGKIEIVFTDFSLSDAVFEASAPFEAVACSQGKTLRFQIEKGISFHGDEAGIRQLVSILLDNAMKYSNDLGTIEVSLSRQGKNKKLTVYNTVDEVPKGSLERLFDRFYRADSSRSRETGGYGIGLSIAQNIVKAHKGKITPHSANDNAIWFTVLL